MVPERSRFFQDESMVSDDAVMSRKMRTSLCALSLATEWYRGCRVTAARWSDAARAGHGLKHKQVNKRDGNGDQVSWIRSPEADSGTRMQVHVID